MDRIQKLITQASHFSHLGETISSLPTLCPYDVLRFFGILELSTRHYKMCFFIQNVIYIHEYIGAFLFMNYYIISNFHIICYDKLQRQFKWTYYANPPSDYTRVATSGDELDIKVRRLSKT